MVSLNVHSKGFRVPLRKMATTSRAPSLHLGPCGMLGRPALLCFSQRLCWMGFWPSLTEPAEKLGNWNLAPLCFSYQVHLEGKRLFIHSFILLL